jgi:uncharacterized membrane protein YhaH (DUF805 family)
MWLLEFLFSPRGRVSRAQMWLGLTLPELVLVSAATAGDYVLAGARLDRIAAGEIMPVPWLGMCVALFFLWPNIVVAVKRFHDRGLSGWWTPGFPILAAAAGVVAVDGAASPGAIQAALSTAAGLAAMAGALLLQFVILYLLPSEEGANCYGPERRRRRPKPEPAREEEPVAANVGRALVSVSEAPRPAAARAVTRCKPVLSSFRGMEAEIAAAPGERSTFGRRGAGD